MRRYFYRWMAASRGLLYLLIRTRLDEAETAAYKLRSRQLIGASSSVGIVLSYPKSGRTWVETMLSYLYVHKFGLPETRVLDFQEDRVELPELPYIFFTHDYAHVTGGRWLIPKRHNRRHFRATPTVMVVRDPIDTAVSMYFQMANREGRLKNVNLFEFVKSGQGGLVTVIEFMNFWARELPQISRHMIVRYEDLSVDPLGGFTKIVRLFGLDFSESALRRAVEFAQFDNLQNLEKSGQLSDWRFSDGNTDSADGLKVRRGKVNGYRDYFDDVQCTVLEQMVARMLNPVYGYCERANRS